MRINPEISRKYQGVYPKEENNMKKKRLFALILSLVMIFTLALPMGGYAEEYFFPEDEFVIDDGGDVWLEEYIEEPVEDYWADEDFLLEDEYTEEPDQFFEDPEFFEENVFEESDELLAVDPNENESEEFILFDAETFDAAELTVTDPEPQTVAEGETATFHVEVSGGTEPYTYQWAAKVGNKWYNSSLNGYNTDTLSFEAVKAWSGRTYRCTVTDSAGTVKTASATLTVVESAAELTVTGPEPQTVAEGETATFHVEVSGGTEPYTYQWAAKVGNTWYNSSLNGYNTDTLSFEAVKAWSGRTYRCTVTDSAGTVKTASATLTVAAELTVTGPEPQTVAEGETATFHVEVSGGTEPYTYQWAAKVGNKWYNSSLNGYNTDTLSFEAVKAWSGRTYRCTVTDSTGTVKTASATLTVESSTIVAEPFVFKKIEGTNNLALIGYTGTDSSITVPGSVNSMTVTEIGVSPLGDGEKGVFEDNTILTSITLPNSITAIRERAFKGCTNLSTMTTY